MFLDQRSNTDLVFVTDFRQKIDMQESGVFNTKFMRHYQDCTRLALFDYKATPTQTERAMALVDARYWLKAHNPKVTCVIPTVAFDPEDRAETFCWRIFTAPEHMAAMRSAFYEWKDGCYVTPLFGPSPFLKVMQQWQNERTMERARKISQGKMKVLTCNAKVTSPSAEDVATIENGVFTAVDIESIEGSDLIMAVGLSRGSKAISVPLDEYLPYGRPVKEPAGAPDVVDALRGVLASHTPKVFHNYTFDIPRLKRRGFEVNGEVHDTFCAMAIAYPELAHGLQSSCAALLPIPPWKSMWHPRLPGFNRDDVEFWTCDPRGLRDYNADDAFYTWHLAAAVMPQVEHTW